MQFTPPLPYLFPVDQLTLLEPLGNSVRLCGTPSPESGHSDFAAEGRLWPIAAPRLLCIRLV
jgi:hypothetical protein